MENSYKTLKGKRVCFFVAETYPAFVGSGQNAFRFADFLTGLGIQCQILCYNYNNKLNQKEIINKVFIRRIVYYNINYLTKILSIPNLIVHYFKGVAGNQIIIIYGRYLIGYPLIILFAVLMRRKIIFRSTLLGCDDMESLKNRHPILWPLYKKLFQKINCYWAINTSFAEKWINYIQKPNSLVNAIQGVNIYKYYPKKQEPEALKKFNHIQHTTRLEILSCGILIKRKGYMDIFQALSKLKIPFHYTILGQHQPDLAHRSSLNEKKEMEILYKAGTKLLGDKIEFVGNATDVLNYYHKSDLFIHGAVTEGTPNVILESMASGLPVICRKMDGLSGNVLKHNLNCFEFNTVEELVNLINQSFENREKLNEISVEAYQLIQKNYSFDITLSKLQKCMV